MKTTTKKNGRCQLNLEITHDLRDRLKMAAIENGVPLYEFAAAALEDKVMPRSNSAKVQAAADLHNAPAVGVVRKGRKRDSGAAAPAVQARRQPR